MEPNTRAAPADAPTPEWHDRYQQARRRHDKARREVERWECRLIALTRGRWQRLLLGRWP